MAEIPCSRRLAGNFYRARSIRFPRLMTALLPLQRSARGSGLIRLGFVRPLGIEFVPHLAADFLRAYPENDIRFTFHTGITQHLLDDLAQRKVDLLFCSKPQDDLKFTAVPVQKQELVVIVPQNHPLAARSAKDGICLSDTASYPHIYFTKTSGYPQCH